MTLSVSIIAGLRGCVGGAWPRSMVMIAGGAASIGDGGGGIFMWDTDTVTADDGGTVLVPTASPRTGCWKRV